MFVGLLLTDSPAFRSVHCQQ